MRSSPVRLTWEGRGEPAVSTPPSKTRGAYKSWSYASPDGGGGRLFQGDNLHVLRDLETEYGEAVTLAYLDPPFLTNRTHDAKDRQRGTLREAFDDRWPDKKSFLETLGNRIVAIRDLLAPHGCMVLHVDPKTSHYVKVLCDEIFGEEAFASEIIWRYRRWPAKTPNFQRVHDVLLRYRKDPKAKPRFNTLFEPLAASTLATWGTSKQRAVYAPNGRRSHSSVTRETTPGVPLGDVWDIGVIAPVSRERTGYPSQKPDALLTRLVSALSDPFDLVLDPYAGSGTTLVAASRHGRRFLGIDQSEVAIETCQKRLRETGLGLVPRLRDSTGRARARGDSRERVSGPGGARADSGPALTKGSRSRTKTVLRRGNPEAYGRRRQSPS